MSSFRRYGGVNYSANNNITRSYIGNSEQFNVNGYSGQQNSKGTFASHIDMSGNSMLHTGSIYFQDGTSLSTATNQGAQGAQGPIGPQGATGPIGPQGVTGSGISNWTLYGTNICNANAGYVGIGTSTPQSALDVNGFATFRTDIALNNTTDNTLVRIAGDLTNNYIQSAFTNQAPKPLIFGPWGSVTGALYIDIPNNRVGINNSIPNQSLDVNGNIVASGTITSGSDYRIKEDITPLSLEEYSVDLLNPVYFKFKNNKKESIGLIAHELKQVFPFLVDGEKDDLIIQSVNYNGLIGVLIKEIQELKKRVKQLEDNNKN